ncbi:MAG: pantoate--beta-alanine ligase [Syntrophomonadaceae bacterium]|nr:pantoate--beta-alanine ligase [Syntrophomonadaceae bacterium]
MRVINSVKEMQQWSQEQRRSGNRLGLVPTMGFLHQGHLSLVRLARADCDKVIVSIFVNPMQFGPNEDLEDYPRDLKRDLTLLEAEGVDAVFNPEPAEMYPDGFSSAVTIEGEIAQKLCGSSRPGHFRGVTTVVCKLFNICLPDKAYFGQKDAQQVMVLEKMVRELNFPLEIIRGPIVREEDGLAMSSRNTYLNEEQRQQALVLSRSLNAAQAAIEGGERDPAKIKALLWEYIEASPLAEVDYIEIYDGEELRDINTIECPALIALAVRFGKTRLIDNLLVEG